uniref:Glycosyltransferase n=1 Tax=Janibacter limosus TaxID=53458 RepID=A0AC61U1W0_9MICO|nr:glycosyltransferase [Janibacter limosus]
MESRRTPRPSPTSSRPPATTSPPVSWSHLYPSFFYPGEQSVPSSGDPDVPPFARTVRALSWARPDSLVRAGRRLRDVDLIVVVHVIPPVVPLHLTLLRAAGVGRTALTGRGPRTAVIAHNVLPHEPHPGDAALMRTFFRRVDAVVVHSAEQSRLARELDAEHVVVTDLPPHLPGETPSSAAPTTGRPASSPSGSCGATRGSTCSCARWCGCPT